jgi:hypothetical protein
MVGKEKREVGRKNKSGQERDNDRRARFSERDDGTIDDE